MRVHDSRLTRYFKVLIFAVLAAASLDLVTPSRCSAGFILGDATNFAVLEEAGGNHNFAINNGTIKGNIGVGAPSGTTTTQVQLSGGAANTILDGNLEFAKASNASGTVGTDY